jgi:hypothetical protein
MDQVESRFESASKEAVDLMEQVRGQWFPDLKDARIRVLFDTKKRTKGPMIVLGRMMKANDLIRRLTEQFAPGGVDYVLFLDKVAFIHMDHDDRIRLIRHELRHCKYNPFANNVWQLIPHDIEDFQVEIAMNKSAAGWATRIAKITADIYEQMKDNKTNKTQVPATNSNVVGMKKREQRAAAGV